MKNITATSSGCSSSAPQSNHHNSKKRSLYSFTEARRIARGHGFDSQDEFLDYTCPGAYQLPKNPDEIWHQEWKGWDDFLGIPYKNFDQARNIARNLQVTSKDAYLQLWEQKKLHDDDPAFRLPYRPDLHFKTEWQGWDDWLSVIKES